MAFGISRDELKQWKDDVKAGKLAFLTHYWYDKRFPQFHAVTKVGCADISKLIKFGEENELRPSWIHQYKEFPHFDLLGERQYKLLKKYGFEEHIHRFRLKKDY